MSENISDLTSITNIFNFFSKANYIVEKDQTPFSISELIGKESEGEAWMVIEQTSLTVLVVKSSSYNQNTYRAIINDHLKELVGTKIIFYTHDFTHYNLTLIFDGIFNIKFKPSNPEILPTRIFECIEKAQAVKFY